MMTYSILLLLLLCKLLWNIFLSLSMLLLSVLLLLLGLDQWFG
jgi:hypothetical protein